MRELTLDEINQTSGGRKLGRFLIDAALGAITGAISGILAGPGAMLTGACIGAIGAMTADIASDQYDAYDSARMTDQARQVELQRNNDDMLRFINA